MYTTIGDRIRDLRKARGLNQDQLAELSNLNRVTVAKYEAGRVEPGAQALSRLADALDVTTDFLLGRGEPTEPSDEKPRHRRAITVEADTVSHAMDQLPKGERDRIIALLQLMYNNDPDIFKRGNDE